MTDDQADLFVLSKANELRKFATSIYGDMAPEAARALGRAIDNDWCRLIDVAPIAAGPGVYRIFRLTDAGMTRMAELVKGKAS